MDPRNTEHVTEFEAALERWDDSRFITKKDLRTVAMFTMYLVNLAEYDGWDLRGHSWKSSDYLGCLVVKAVVGGVPSVVFTSAKTLVGGMFIFLRKMEGGFLEWVPDKYA